MRIGKYELKTYISGYFALDGGGMFGIIPKSLWEKTNPSDSKNRVTLSARNLLLTSNDKKILIDTGMGGKWDEKSRLIYNITTAADPGSESTLPSIDPDEITDVLLTHLHFDHAGGATKYQDGKIVPAFPNARYFVQKKNLDWAMNPSERDRGSYLKENFEPLLKEGLLTLLDGKIEFDENISLEVINGHTFAQQMVRISDPASTVLYCADLMPFVSHISIPYVMGYDLQPLITVQEKKIFLKKAAEENWLLYFGHDPGYALASVKFSGKGIEADKLFRDFEV